MQAASHDPYRPSAMNVPQLDPEDLTETTGPVHVFAYVDRYPPWVNAGAEWMLHSMFRRLVDAGHRVSVVCPIPDHVHPKFPEIVDGVYVYDDNAGSDVAEEIAANADVMVGQLLYTRFQVALAAKLRKPLIYVLHNDSQIAHWHLTANNVTLLVPNSYWIDDTLRGRWPGPRDVCRPPVFCDDYTVESDEARRFVTLVNLIPEKGVETFYELARVRYRDRFLGVTGAYGHQHRPPRGRENVTIIPPTAHIRDDVYAKTRVLLMPSWYESWGRAAVEAMAAGCPVIAGPTPGLREALGDAVQFVDPSDLSGWVAALRRLDDPIEWRLWQARGRERAAELERLTDGDLTEFERWVRRCAAIPTEGPERPLEGSRTAGSGSGG